MLSVLLLRALGLRMALAAVATALALVSSATHAADQGGQPHTASELKEWCRDIEDIAKSTVYPATRCIWYIRGILDAEAIRVTDAPNGAQRIGSLCIPAEVTFFQLTLVFNRHIAIHPEQLHWCAPGVLMLPVPTMKQQDELR